MDPRRGMALPMALFALVLMGALVAGGFAGAVLEQRAGRNAMYALQASAAAETGLAAVIGQWNAAVFEGIAPGDSTALRPVVLSSGLGYSATVSRLTGRLFLIRATGSRADADGGLLARREVSLLARLADSLIPGSPAVRPLANRAWSAGS